MPYLLLGKEKAYFQPFYQSNPRIFFLTQINKRIDLSKYPWRIGTYLYSNCFSFLSSLLFKYMHFPQHNFLDMHADE